MSNIKLKWSKFSFKKANLHSTGISPKTPNHSTIKPMGTSSNGILHRSEHFVNRYRCFDSISWHIGMRNPEKPLLKFQIGIFIKNLATLYIIAMYTASHGEDPKSCKRRKKKLFIYPCHLFVYCHDESVTRAWQRVLTSTHSTGRAH